MATFRKVLVLSFLALAVLSTKSAQALSREDLIAQNDGVQREIQSEADGAVDANDEEKDYSSAYLQRVEAVREAQEEENRLRRDRHDKMIQFWMRH